MTAAAGALKEALGRKGLPLTHQRLAIYEALSGTRAHPSAESLYGELKRRYPSLSLATVYKTLQTFHELGLVSLVNRPHTEARYDAITGVHHHAICLECGRIEDVFDAGLDRLAAPSVPGFSALSAHSVHFYGICDGCKRKKNGGRRHG